MAGSCCSGSSTQEEEDEKEEKDKVVGGGGREKFYCEPCGTWKNSPEEKVKGLRQRIVGKEREREMAAAIGRLGLYNGHIVYYSYNTNTFSIQRKYFPTRAH